MQSVLSCDEKVAQEYLTQAKWEVDQAIDNYFQNPPKTISKGQNKQPIKQNIENIFKKYKNADADIISGEGIVKFCQDLGIDWRNPIIIVISYLLDAKQMGLYEKDEFINGMAKNNWDSIETIKKQLKELQTYLNEPNKFKEVYAFTFNYAKIDQRQKGLPFQSAQSLWELFFKQSFSLWPKWNDYLNQLPKKLDITKDQWSMFYEFIQSTQGDITKYTEDGAWPLIIDGFVEFIKNQQ